MLSKNRHLKHLLMLLVAQIACLALGLSIHYGLVVSAVSRAAEDEALAELAADADQLLAAVAGLDLRDRPSVGARPAALGQIRRILETKGPIPGVQLTVVDSQWRVLTAPQGPGGHSPTSELPAETLVWARPPEDIDGSLGRVRGSLTMPDGPHLAVACRLGGDQGYAVVHRPLEDVKVAPAVLVRSLPAAGVITWIWTSVLLVIAVYMIVTRLYDELSKKRTQAEAAALKRTQSLVRTRDAVIFGLAKLAESRDLTTGNHLERVSAYATRLAMTLRHHPKYRGVVSPEFVQLIGISSALHDIGKVGIEDSILFKHGPLTEAERARMQQHTSIAAQYLLDIERRLGSSDFLRMARQIALSHHERWDGSGYPGRLAGEEIPLAARIVAIADAYEALSSLSVYKAPLRHEECVKVIRDEAGRQFDPHLVEAFFKVENSFRQLAHQYGNDTLRSRKPVYSGAGSSDDRRCVGSAPLTSAPEEVRAAAPEPAKPGIVCT